MPLPLPPILRPAPLHLPNSLASTLPSMLRISCPYVTVSAMAISQAVGKEAFAIVAGEIGGGNGLEAVNVAAAMNLPVVDADFMGRAFPELQVSTTCIWASALGCT